MSLVSEYELKRRRAKCGAPSAPLFESAKDAAFRRLRETGELTRSCKLVMDLIRRYGPITIQQLEERHHVKINIGSGRTSDLKRMGYIEECGEVVNPDTNRRNTLYRAVP